MRVMKVIWPILCAFLCGFSLHALLGTDVASTGTATSITRWLVPLVMGLAAIEGAWRSLRATQPPRTSN